MVILDAVSRHFKGDSIRAVDSVSLSVPRGEFLAVLGPSGSGKSTLLHLIGGIERPDSGTVTIDGVTPRSGIQWSKVRAEKIGFVFQGFHLVPTLTALENIELPMFGVTGNGKRRRAKALDLLDMVGLGRRGRHRPGELSGGECQRVAIARSLANDPLLLLADEPTGNLDTRTSREILTLFQAILQRDSNKSLILVTHETAIAEGATRKIHFLDGKIDRDESQANKPAHPAPETLPGNEN